MGLSKQQDVVFKRAPDVIMLVHPEYMRKVKVGGFSSRKMQHIGVKKAITSKITVTYLSSVLNAFAESSQKVVSHLCLPP